MTKKNKLFLSPKALIKDLLHDQKEMWLSPLKIHQRDSRWLVPIALTTATLFVTDRHVTRRIDGGEEKAEVSSFLSRFGTSYTDFGIAGSFFAAGTIMHNERATETGALAIQALINSSIVVTGLKYIAERERPSASKGDGHFFERGSSFPSGHAVSVWALATVIADEYKDKPLIRIAAYGVATAVGVARVTGRNHFSSDVFVGGTLGYLIGHYTVRRYSKHQGGRLTPAVSPYVNPRTRTYGLAAGLSF